MELPPCPDCISGILDEFSERDFGALTVQLGSPKHPDQMGDVADLQFDIRWFPTTCLKILGQPCRVLRVPNALCRKPWPGGGG